MELVTLLLSLAKIVGTGVLTRASGNTLEYKRSLAIDQEVLGENHPEVVTDLKNLAGLYFEMGKYTDASLVYKRALNILGD
jgi:tetratricopeptide (TPR) repeat protein